jgi:hypothetical protein
MEDNVHSRKVCRFPYCGGCCALARGKRITIPFLSGSPKPSAERACEVASARSARVSGFLRCSLRGGEGLGRLLSFAFESFDLEGPPPPGRD